MIYNSEKGKGEVRHNDAFDSPNCLPASASDRDVTPGKGSGGNGTALSQFSGKEMEGDPLIW